MKPVRILKKHTFHWTHFGSILNFYYYKKNVFFFVDSRFIDTPMSPNNSERGENIPRSPSVSGSDRSRSRSRSHSPSRSRSHSRSRSASSDHQNDSHSHDENTIRSPSPPQSAPQSPPQSPNDAQPQSTPQSPTDSPIQSTPQSPVQSPPRSIKSISRSRSPSPNRNGVRSRSGSGSPSGDRQSRSRSRSRSHSGKCQRYWVLITTHGILCLYNYFWLMAIRLPVTQWQRSFKSFEQIESLASKWFTQKPQQKP